jgi:hypothetical protein
MLRTEEPPHDGSQHSLPASVAAANLSGLSLGKAFRKFVFEDCHVSTLGASLVKQGHCDKDIFSEARYPELGTKFGWPLDVNESDLAYDLAGGFLRPVSAPPIAPSIREAAKAIVCKIQEFRGFLELGELVGHGMSERTGAFGPIPRLQWGRRGMIVEVQSSDLLREIDHKRDVQWSGIVLERVNVRSAEKQAAHPNQASSTEPTIGDVSRELHGTRLDTTGADQQSVSRRVNVSGPPSHASIEAAFQALWHGQLPAGQRVQVRDREIMDWQRKHGHTVVSSKTIQRYFKARKQKT